MILLSQYLKEKFMELIEYSEERYDAEIAEKIIALEKTAWPQNTEDDHFPTAPNTYVMSFVLMENDMAVCHIGVRKSILRHKGEEYLAYGLSEVVTHPHYQNKGLASQTIKKAVQFMISQQADISIFTCAQEKSSFYTRGGWEVIPGACLIGGTEQKPFRSDSLNLVTMMMFLSNKSKQHRKDFAHTDICLVLGENQLW